MGSLPELEAWPFLSCLRLSCVDTLGGSLGPSGELFYKKRLLTKQLGLIDNFLN